VRGDVKPRGTFVTEHPREKRAGYALLDRSPTLPRGMSISVPNFFVQLAGESQTLD